MRRKYFYSAAALLTIVLPLRAHASTVSLSFLGPGVSGTVALTYGSVTDATYPLAFAITGVSGTFSDSNLGIVNAAITGLEPISYATPEATNLLAPSDFSRYAVAVGTQHGTVNYDNLYYPGGSPQTASSYPFHGGPLDIYGLLFDLGNGDAVNLYSNGVLPGSTSVDYGVSVSTHAVQLDSVDGGVVLTPEPESLFLLGTGLVGTFLKLRSRRR